jgi:hypothetical protein
MVVAPPLMVRCRTTIPREVDLGGSSAMVTTALWGLAELHRGDRGELRRLVDQNFDARSRLYPLDPRHVRMVDVARSLGAPTTPAPGARSSRSRPTGGTLSRPEAPSGRRAAS